MNSIRCSCRAFAFAVVAAWSIAAAQVCPVTPSDSFASGDVDNSIRSMVVWNGEVYAGGFFTNAGGIAANRVARWDGQRWSPMGAGFNSIVNALVVFNNELYAGGSFSLSGATPVQYVAKWNGSAWVAANAVNQLNTTVNDLAVFNGALYATGSFTNTTPFGAALNGFARLTATGWVGVGTGLNSTGEALHVHNNELYVGGIFETANGVAAPRIARFTGSTFAPVGPGFGNGQVNTLTTHNGSLYAGGTFTLSGAVSLNRIARFNSGSSTWVDVGAGVNSTVYKLASHNDGTGQALYVGGAFTIAGVDNFRYLVKFNNIEWTQVADFNGAIHEIAAYTGPRGPGLIVAGDFTSVGTVPTTFAAITAWYTAFVPNAGPASDLGRGVNGVANAFTVHAGDLYVGGSFSRADGVAVSNVARQSGASFQPAGSTIFNGEIRALASFAGQVWAGGDFFVSGGLGFNRVARFDGTNWIAADTGLNSNVNTLAIHNNELYAAGVFSANGANTVQLGRVARWTGTTWASVGDGFNTSAFDLATYNGSLYACGAFTQNANGNAAQPALRIARYDPATSTWVRVAQGLNNQANALAVFQGELYVAGMFTTAGLTSATRIARWNPTDGWQDVGGGLNNTVNDIAVYNDGSGEALWAVGTFTQAGSVPVAGFAKWDGTAWCAAGTGMPSSQSGQALYSTTAGGGRRLYIGGTFDSVSGASGNNMAVITGCVADIDNGSGQGIPDGGVDINDLLYFIVLFDLGDAAADVDDGSGSGTPDGGVTIVDLLYFLVRFDAGC